MGFFGVRFRDVADEFLACQKLYSDDRMTVASNVRILMRYLGPMRLKEIGPPQRYSRGSRRR